METVWSIGITWNIFFQNLGLFLKTPMEVFSFFGTELFFLMLLPALYWCIDKALGLRVGIILLLCASINDGFKLLLHGPRPYWLSSEIIKYAGESSFGVPSGHTQTAVGVWGMIAAGIGRWWAWLIASVIILMIGISRLYLGVHFPHDVFAGLLLGILILWLVLRYMEPVSKWLKRMDPVKQLFISFLCSLVLILFSMLPFLWLKITEWQMPAAWMEFGKNAVSLKFAFSTGGMFFGFFAGLIWFNKLGGFSSDGTVIKRILRYILGLTGLFVLYFGLKKISGFISADTESAIPYLLRYIRYSLISLWISVFAPWIFIKLKLAQKSS